MLVGFHFDEDFLSCDEITSSHSNSINLSLLEFWNERGCFIFPFSNLSKYKEWIDFIPPKHMTRWQAALSNNLKCNMSSKYRKLEQYSDVSVLRDACETNGVGLVIVPDSFNSFGLSSETDIVSSDFDLCKVSNFIVAPSVSKSKVLANKGILPGEKIENIWREQFLNVAKYSKNITIIDRYFIENLRKEMALKHSPMTSLEKFTSLLSPCNKKYNINIISVGGVKNSQSHIEVENYIRKFIAKEEVSAVISSLIISSCDDAIFRSGSHERYIGFDNFIYKIDRGMQIFSPYPMDATSISIFRKTNNSTFNYAYKTLMSQRLWVL